MCKKRIPGRNRPYNPPEHLILVNECTDPAPKNVAEIWKNGIHQIETLFLVKRTSNPPPTDTSIKFDYGMQGTKWLSKEDLASLTYYPDVDSDWFFAPKNPTNNSRTTNR